jgi:hypothetical protein
MHNNLSLGEAVLKQVFNYNDIPVVTELSRSIGEQWKLMLSYITDIEAEENNISFSIRDGFFNDIVTKLELLNVSNEDYKNIYNDSYNFKSNKVRQIFMRQDSKEGYTIYLKNKTSNGFITEWTKDNSDASEYSIEESEDTNIIKCSEILITYYNRFVRELKERGIQCISRDEFNDEKFNAKNLRKQWLDTFAHDVDITGIHTEQNLWHVFSYNKVKGFEKEEANKKFDDLIKKSLYIFFDSTENCYKLKNAQNLTLKDIEQYNSMDVYIVNEEFTWTYVLTHEAGWLGPFFYAI